MCTGHRRGLTKAELAVVLVVLAAIIAIVVVLRPKEAEPSRPAILDDATQIRKIQQSWIIYAREHGGQYPVPGNSVKQTLMDFGGGRTVPDVYEDRSMLNTTASLFSLCIMQNYFSPELCVGPTEPSGNVFIFDEYNWDSYDPNADVWWDPNFAADLKSGSNVSYAHMPLVGERMTAQWRESLDAQFAIVGNRGPKDGDNLDSITYEIHGDHLTWVGNVVFNDNHVLTTTSFSPERDDNLFKMEEGAEGGDAILGFTIEMWPAEPVLIWD